MAMTTIETHRCPSCHELHPLPSFHAGGDVLLDGIPVRLCRECYRRIRNEAHQIREILPVEDSMGSIPLDVLAIRRNIPEIVLPVGDTAGSTPATGHREVPTLHETKGG